MFVHCCCDCVYCVLFVVGGLVSIASWVLLVERCPLFNVGGVLLVVVCFVCCALFAVWLLLCVFGVCNSLFAM